MFKFLVKVCISLYLLNICRWIKLIFCMLVDTCIGLKFYAVPSLPPWEALRSRSWVIDFNRFSDKAQVRRATLSCDSSYFCYTDGTIPQLSKSKISTSLSRTCSKTTFLVFSCGGSYGIWLHIINSL